MACSTRFFENFSSFLHCISLVVISVTAGLLSCSHSLSMPQCRPGNQPLLTEGLVARSDSARFALFRKRSGVVHVYVRYVHAVADKINVVSGRKYTFAMPRPQNVRIALRARGRGANRVELDVAVRTVGSLKLCNYSLRCQLS